MNRFLCIPLMFISHFGNTQELYFPPLSGGEWETQSPETLGWCEEKIDSLYNFLESENTRAFILLKDGKIVLEQYFGDFNQSDSWYWASAGKGITAFMTGIAQQENHLSILDPASDYLGTGWTNLTPDQEDLITIRHQLTMTTGLNDGVIDPYCTIDTCLIYEADAGTRWAYHNAPYTLLDQVISNATGQGLNLYTTQKLMNPTGMTGLFWPIGYNNVFLSNARSMARFGLLMLNKGNWNGDQIMTDSVYFNQMISPSQELNESYGYLWWLNGQNTFMVPQTQFTFNGPFNLNAPDDMYAAIGMSGQLLNIVPGQNMVWLRMGDSPGSVQVPYLTNDIIWEYLNDLECHVSTIDPDHYSIKVSLYPNPHTGACSISTNEFISGIIIINSRGSVEREYQNINGKAVNLNLTELIEGIYLTKIFFKNGKSVTKKISIIR
ncbi:MAG TPA: serine hydrolase [Membranihabitans sp.]|nr:serine hydrolase [Membranihabitans sp.]